MGELPRVAVRVGEADRALCPRTVLRAVEDLDALTEELGVDGVDIVDPDRELQDGAGVATSDDGGGDQAIGLGGGGAG